MIVENIDYNLIYDIISEKNHVDYIDEITIEDTIEYDSNLCKSIQKDVIVIYYKGINHHIDEFFIDVDEYKERIILLRDKKINQILKK
jgi:AmiR/NasT family two-component response regulator